MQASRRSFTEAKSCDAMPDPFCRLIVEQAASTTEDGRGHYQVFRDHFDSVCGDLAAKGFAVGETIYVETKAIVPFDAAPETTRCKLYGRVQI